MTRTADLLTVTTSTDEGAEIPRYTNFRAVVPLDENRRYVSSGGEVSVRIEANDAQHDESCCDSDNLTYLWEGLVPHRHVSDEARYILETAMDQLAREGFKVDAKGWKQDGENWVAGIVAQPEAQRCHCLRFANHIFTPLDPQTGAADEMSTFYRCSVHAYLERGDNLREWQICWRGMEVGPEPRCLEPIEFEVDERDFGGWKHVDRRITREHHHAAPRI